MFILCLFVSFTFLPFSAMGEEVCYDYYGCFSDGYPWTDGLNRPLSALPQEPNFLGLRTLLHTRSNPDEADEWEILANGDDLNVLLSPFSADRRTVVIVHGFTHSSKTEWVQQMKDELLEAEDLNVLLMDWEDGASPNYLRATSNIRLVAVHVQLVLQRINALKPFDVSDLHIISHGLGAHAAGYIGKAIPVRRISAIDPSGLYFDGCDPQVKLQSTDAGLVDVVYTNGRGLLGLGSAEQLGTVNFYPNGGNVQTGCSDTLGTIIDTLWELLTLDFEGAIDDVSCSHVKGIQYWLESINNRCLHAGTPCLSYDFFSEGRCFSRCRYSGNCLPAGYYADIFPPTGDDMYFSTQDSETGDLCHKWYDVEFTVDLNQKTTSGTVDATIVGNAGTVPTFRTVDGSIVSGARYDRATGTGVQTGNVGALSLRYQRSGMFQERELVLSRARVSVLESTLEVVDYEFGPATLINGETITLLPLGSEETGE